MEFLARCVRSWRDAETLEPEEVKLAETVIKAGLIYFPASAFITVMYGNFMIECQDNYHSGTSQLRAAKKMNPSPIEKFIIFVRESEHMQKVQQQAGGESTVDLVSYVEFNRNFKWVPPASAAAVSVALRISPVLTVHTHAAA